MRFFFKIAITCALLGSFQLATSQTMYKIDASDPNIQYTGRIDDSNPNNVAFSFPGVSIKAKFQGTAIDAVIKEYGSGGATTTNYFNVIIDGGTPVKLKLSRTQTIYELARDLSNGEHTIELFKLTESSVGKVEFQGFQLESGKTLLAPDPLPAKKIEFIGNSITCGYGNEAKYTQAQLATISGFNSKNENNYNAWGAVTARNLGVQYSCVAYSGRGLYMNNTGSTTNTIPLIYDNIIADEPAKKWNTQKYVPNVIVINLGTNDFAAEAGASKTVDRTKFVDTYISFIEQLKSYYPNVTIICAVGVMMSDWYPVGAQHWTRIQEHVQAVTKHFNGNKVHYFKMEPQAEKNGYGEDWHPSAVTHLEMAAQLTDFINNLPPDTWDNCTDCYTPVSNGKVANWEGNKKAAVALTFDDWSPGHSKIVIPELKNRNLVGTFYVCPGWYPDWASIKTAAGNGNEIGNHSKTHVADYINNLQSEVNDAKNTIETNVPSQKVYTYAYPFGTFNAALIERLKTTGHIASRGVSGPNTKSNSYNFATTEDDYYNINAYGMKTSTTINNFTTPINNVIKGGGLLIYLYHSVNSATVIDNGYEPVSEANFQEQLNTIVSFQDQIWVTTFANAVKYHREANCASLQEIEAPNNNRWVINLTHTLPDKETYNYPLTVMLKMNGLNYNKVTQNSNQLPYTTFNDTIMFKAVPDGGNIILEINGSSITASTSYGNEPIVIVTPENISISSENQISTINLINMQGTTISAQKVQNKSVTIPITSLPKGVYLAKIIYAGKQPEVVRFIK